jgi:hypothetical protein
MFTNSDSLKISTSPMEIAGLGVLGPIGRIVLNFMLRILSYILSVRTVKTRKYFMVIAYQFRSTLRHYKILRNSAVVKT